MISCTYCGFSHEIFQSRCSACGAPLSLKQNTIIETEKPNTDIFIEKIKRICRQNILMYNISVFQAGSSISEKKLKVIESSFKAFPKGKEIYFYCDTSALNNGKQGLMICENGIFWQNNWVNPTNRNFLDWGKFKERKIILKKYNLDLGEGDIINLAGLGRDSFRIVIEGIFQHIQKIIKDN